MCAKKANGFVPRRKIDKRVRNFGRVTFPLVGRRDTVSDFGNSVRIGRTGKTAHANQNIFVSVNDAETELPWIGFARILDILDRVR